MGGGRYTALSGGNYLTCRNSIFLFNDTLAGCAYMLAQKYCQLFWLRTGGNGDISTEFFFVLRM